MALTYTTDFKGQSLGVSTTITSNTLSITTGDFIDIVVCYGDNTYSTAWTVSNTGTAITWSGSQDTNTADNVRVVHWTGIAGATPPTTVSVLSTAGAQTNGGKIMLVVVSTGQHATTPLPAGNLFAGVGGTDVSQSITPTSSGSCLWMFGGDWNTTNTFGVAANCTAVATAFDDSEQTGIAIRPTTQPRSDAASFTIGETDTGGKVSWVAWEVQSAPSGGTPQTLYPASDHTDGAWTPSTGTDNYAVLDDESDAEWSSTNSNSALRLNLQNGSTPDSGTRTLTVRAFGSSEKKLIVRLIEGTTTVQTFTHDPIQVAIGAYAEVVTNAITNYADLDVECEIADATTPPTPTVAFGAIGTTGSTTATTTVTAAYPTGITTESALYLIATGRSNTAGTEFAITGGGWTNLGTLEGGTGTWALDTGTRRVTMFRKDTVAGTETGNVTVTLAGTTANTLYARIVRIQPPAGGWTISQSWGSGSDTTHGTGYSATSGTALSWQAGDLLLYAMAGCTDTLTSISAQAITASGATFTQTNRASIAVTGGNDHRHYVETATVNTGSGSSAPVHSFTVTSSQSGPTGFLRIRATSPTEKGRITSIKWEIPAAGGESHTGTVAAKLAARGAAPGFAKTATAAAIGRLGVRGGSAGAKTVAYIAAGRLAASGATTGAAIAAEVHTGSVVAMLAARGAAAHAKSVTSAAAGRLAARATSAAQRIATALAAGRLAAAGAASGAALTAEQRTGSAVATLATRGATAHAKTVTTATAGTLASRASSAIAKSVAGSAIGRVALRASALGTGSEIRSGSAVSRLAWRAAAAAAKSAASITAAALAVRGVAAHGKTGTGTAAGSASVRSAHACAKTVAHAAAGRQAWYAASAAGKTVAHSAAGRVATGGRCIAVTGPIEVLYAADGSTLLASARIRHADVAQRARTGNANPRLRTHIST